jgi:hypothetical protein
MIWRSDHGYYDVLERDLGTNEGVHPAKPDPLLPIAP